MVPGPGRRHRERRPVTVINRQKIIEAAATAIHDAACTFHSDRGISVGHYSIEMHAAQDAALALPVIVAAVLKPIRELHREQFQFCRECDADYPCPTIQLCDEIEAAAKGGE